MDLDKNKEVCGTCEDWCGKRECPEGGEIIRVGASTKGNCRKRNKSKTPQGGCDEWRKLDGEEPKKG